MYNKQTINIKVMIKELAKPTEATEEKLFKLIDGIFSPEDAREILLHIIENKIHFHNLRIFGTEERFGVKDEHSIKRVQELKETRDQIVAVLDEAKEKRKNITLRSLVSIDVL